MSNETPLRNALRKLLAQGEEFADNRMRKDFAAKTAPPPSSPEMCDDCKVEMVDGKCPQCGKAGGENENELADALEMGSAGE